MMTKQKSTASLQALALISLIGLSTQLQAAPHDDDWFTTGGVVDIDVDPGNQADTYSWEGEWLIGTDFNKLALKTEGEREDGETADASFQALYSRNFSKFWDWRAGLRQETDPQGDTSFVLAIAGLAPYVFDVEGSAYINGDGVKAEINLAYELQLTQRFVLELYNNSNWNGYEESASDTGKGLAQAEFGSQLRYEFNRHFGTYIDLYQSRNYGDTAALMKSSGEDIRQSGVRFGLRFFNF